MAPPLSAGLMTMSWLLRSCWSACLSFLVTLGVVGWWLVVCACKSESKVFLR